MDYNISYRDKDKGIQVIISYKDHNGKWKQKSKQGFKKKSDAKKAANEMLDKLKEDSKIILSKDHQGITFKEFADMFLESEKLYKEPNTIDAYGYAIIYFKDIYDIELCNVTYFHLKTCIDKMVASGVSIGTINTHIKRTKSLFNYAVNPYKIIKDNPMKDIKTLEEKTEYKIKALNKWELDKLLGRIRQEDLYLATKIASSCGLRLGEMVGLTWNDVDEANLMLNVNKQWKVLKDGKIGFGKLKTKNSYRSVPIPPILLSELLQYKKNNPTDIYNRIFLYNRPNSLGSKIIYNYNALGFNNSIHDMRHTYATLLIANGVDFKTVAKLLGDTVEMVMKVYSHVTDEMMDNAIKTVNNIFK